MTKRVKLVGFGVGILLAVSGALLHSPLMLVGIAIILVPLALKTEPTVVAEAHLIEAIEAKLTPPPPLPDQPSQEGQPPNKRLEPTRRMIKE